MEFAGLTLPQLLGVFGAAGTATVALYLLRLRLRRVSVPFLALWSSASERSRSSRLFASLRHLLSLLLALSIVSLLTLALGDPRPVRQGDGSRHLVVLVDASVTMQVREAGGDRLHLATRRARELIDDLDRDDVMLLAQVDSEFAPLTPFTGDREALRQALTRIEATDLPLRLEPALAVARDIASGRANATLVVISDFAGSREADLNEAIAALGVPVRTLGVGTARRNVGLSAFAIRRYPLDASRSQAFVEVFNAGPADERVELQLLADQQPIRVEAFPVAAGARVQRVYDDVAGVDRRVEARVALAATGADALPADDRAHAVLPARRRARVLAVTSDNLYLEAALLLDEYLTVETVAPSEYVSARGHDVVIFDRFVPSEVPDVPGIYLAPDGGTGFPCPVVGRLVSPFVDHVARDAPVLRWTALQDVNVGHALHLRAQPGDRVLAASQQGAPLLIRGERAGVPLFVLAFDVRDSDLPLRVAWPVLLLGMIDALTGSDPGYVDTHRVGERVELPVPDAEAGAWQERDGFAREALAVQDGRVFVQSRRAGFVQVGTPSGSRVLAFNLRPETPHDVSPRLPAATREPAPARPDRVRRWWTLQPVWALALSLVAALLLLEWLSYQRRWTL